MHERFSSSVDVSFVRSLSTTKKEKKTFSRLQSCRTFSPPFFYIKYIGKSILYRDSVHNNNNSREWLAFLCVCCVHHLTLSSISFFIIMDIKKNARHYPILLSLPTDRDGRTDTMATLTGIPNRYYYLKRS